MTDIYALVYGTLSAVGYPVRKQGGFSDKEALPETFLTYQIIGSPDISFADNIPTGRTTRVQVTLYSKDPEKVQGADTTIKNVMRQAGFLRIDGRDLPADAETGHSGYTCDYRLYNRED